MENEAALPPKFDWPYPWRFFGDFLAVQKVTRRRGGGPPPVNSNSPALPSTEPPPRRTASASRPTKRSAFRGDPDI